jgi:hypothetical protein
MDDDDTAWYMPSDDHPEPPAAPRNGRRRPYGSGIDARRTAQFRAYHIETSPIFRCLERIYGKVTKEMLTDVIVGALHHALPSRRPPPPSRSQKRAKAGLATWIDDNALFVMDFLRSQPSIF